MGRRGLLLTALAAIALLGTSSSALAGPDVLKGGSVAIQLQGSKALKLSPRSLTLPITGGAVDPIDGSGSVTTTGSFKAKHGGRKVKVKITGLTFGANGGPGSIAAKIGKKVTRFGALGGGTVSRDGWGAKIENVTATLASKGASALNRVFSPKRGKGAKSAAKSGVRAGAALGSVTATTVPKTVEVVAGSGEMSLNTPLAFANKLDAHCVDALSGGVAPIAPATQNITTFTFPVSGGALAPDFSDGKIQTAGGQSLTKNNGGLIPIQYPDCTTAEPPVGTSIVQTDFAADFGIQSLTAHAFPPDTDLGVSAVGGFDYSGATMTVDPASKEVTISNVGVTLAPLAATVLNNLFPNQSGDPSNDFSTSDSLGTVDATAKLR